MLNVRIEMSNRFVVVFVVYNDVTFCTKNDFEFFIVIKKIVNLLNVVNNVRIVNIVKRHFENVFLMKQIEITT